MSYSFDIIQRAGNTLVFRVNDTTGTTQPVPAGTIIGICVSWDMTFTRKKTGEANSDGVVSFDNLETDEDYSVYIGTPSPSNTIIGEVYTASLDYDVLVLLVGFTSNTITFESEPGTVVKLSENSSLSGATTMTVDQSEQVTFTGLTPNTKYYYGTDEGLFGELTTSAAVVDNTPKIATQSQWEDLADRVQSKAEIGTVLSTPSNTAYVGTNNIVNGAVTSSKIDSSVIGLFYPVGSIYMSATLSTAAQVEAVLGGTWVAWGAGRVPVGVDTSDTDFDAAEETGGEKTHQLTNGELPKLYGEGQFKPYDGFSTAGIVSGKSWSQTKNFSAANGTQSHSTLYGFQINFGNDEAHNNLQPYITCYMYKRTA